jgi:hypothetical protein
MELDDSDYLSYRLDQVRKDHSLELKASQNQRSKAVLDLIEDIALKGQSPKTSEFSKRIKAFVSTVNSESEESELITYNEWIDQKIKE